MAEVARPSIDRGMRGIFRDAGKLLRSEFAPIEGAYFEERYFNGHGFDALEVRASDQGEFEPHNVDIDYTIVEGHVWTPKPNSPNVPTRYAAMLGISHSLTRSTETPKIKISDEYVIEVTYTGTDDVKGLQTERIITRTQYAYDAKGIALARREVGVEDSRAVRSRSEVSDFLQVAVTTAAAALSNRPEHIAALAHNYPALTA